MNGNKSHNRQLKLEGYKIDELLDVFEYTVCYWHYDPHSGSKTPKYSIEELRDEIHNRIQAG